MSVIFHALSATYLRAREKVQGRKIRKLNWEGFFLFLMASQKQLTSFPYSSKYIKWRTRWRLVRFLFRQRTASTVSQQGRGGSYSRESRVDVLLSIFFKKLLLKSLWERKRVINFLAFIPSPPPPSPYSFMRSRAIVTHLACFAKSSEDSLWWDDRMTYLVCLVLFLSQPLITPLMLLSH